MAYVARGRAATTVEARLQDFQLAEPLLTALQNDDKVESAVRGQATLILAQLYVAEKKYDQADTSYAKALLGLDANGPSAMAIHFDRANMLFNADRLADAAGEYELIVNGKDQTNGHEAAYWLGSCRYGLAKKSHDRVDYSRAITALKQYLTGINTDDPHGARAQLLLAYSQEDSVTLGDDAARTQAISSYTFLQTKWPQSIEAREVSNGLLRLTNGLKEDALAAILPLLSDSAASWSITLQLARQSYLNNQNQQVIDAMHKLLQKKLNDEFYAQASYLLGAAALRLDGHVAEAIPAFIQALEKAGTDDLRALAAQGLTQAYLNSAQFSTAIESAKKLTQLPLSSTDANEREHEKALRWELLGRAYAGAKDYARVINAYQQLIDECPHATNRPNALYACGWAAEGMKDPAKAEAYYRKLITDYPTADVVSGATLRYTELLLAEKNFQSVIDLLAKFPNNAAADEQAEAAFSLALAFAGLGKDDEANTRFSALADKFPTSTYAAESLARVGQYQMHGQHFAEAKVAFTRCLTMLPMDNALLPMIFYNLGACDLRLNAYADAVKDFDSVLNKFPASDSTADSRYWKGQALELQGKDKASDARACYQQYLDSNPSGACALDAALGAGRAALLGERYDAGPLLALVRLVGRQLHRRVLIGDIHHPYLGQRRSILVVLHHDVGRGGGAAY